MLLKVIQQIAIYSNAFSTGNDYLAGQTEAYIMQILLGAEQPTVLPAPQLNFTKYVPYDSDTFYAQFYTTYLNSFNITNQTQIDIFIQCGTQSNNLTLDILRFRQDFTVATDLYQRLTVIQQGVDSIIGTIQNCYEAEQLERQLFAPLYNTFKAAPVQTILQVVYNVARNLPQIFYSQEQMVVAVEQGEYSLAGEITAQQAKTYLNGLTYN